jgi:hypothetical protein
MHAMTEIRNTLEKELDKIADKGSINETDLGHIDKLTHSIKSIDTIMAMKDSGYSNRAHPHYYDNSYDGGNSYGRYGYSREDGYSYARRGRDGDGDGRYNERGYSRAGSMRDRLEAMMHEAETDTEREAIRRAMSQMKD